MSRRPGGPSSRKSTKHTKPTDVEETTFAESSAPGGPFDPEVDQSEDPINPDNQTAPPGAPADPDGSDSSDSENPPGDPDRTPHFTPPPPPTYPDFLLRPSCRRSSSPHKMGRDHSILTENAVKLKSEADWRPWHDALCLGLNAIDDRFLQIMNGSLKDPGFQGDPDDDLELTIAVARIQNIHVGQVLEIDVLRLGRKAKDWRRLDNLGRALIVKTLGPMPMANVARSTTLKGMYDTLVTLYRKGNYQANYSLWDKWYNLRFKTGDSAVQFHHDFTTNLQNFRATVPDDSISDLVAFYAFIGAIRGHPDSNAFLAQLDVKEITASSLDDIYAKFLLIDSSLHLSRHRDTAHTAHATSTDGGRGGRGGGRGGRGGGQNGRGGHQQSQDTTQEVSGETATDKNAIWCPYHGRFGAHLPSSCHLPEDKRQNKPLPKVEGKKNRKKQKDKRANAASAEATTDVPAVPAANAIYDGGLWASLAVFDDGYSKPNPSTNLVSCGEITISPQAANELLSASTSPEDILKWMLDSGTSHHMTPYRSVFSTYERYAMGVRSATGARFWAIGRGDVIVNLADLNGQPYGEMTLHNVYHAPALSASLLSISDSATQGLDVTFGAKFARFMPQNGSSIPKAYADRTGTHYFLNTLSSSALLDSFMTTREFLSFAAAVKDKAAIESGMKPIHMDLAHRRMIHSGQRRVKKTIAHSDGVTILPGTAIPDRCAPCIQGKGHSLPFGTDKRIKSLPGETLHIDVWGPISIKSIRGQKYYLTVTDEASRFCWLFLISHRDEVFSCFLKVEAFLKTQLNLTVKRVCGDNAGEHVAIAQHLESRGAIWDPSPPHTPQLNGIAEIKNRYLVEPLVAIMTEYQLPKFLWGEVIQGVNFTANRLWHSKIDQSPYEALFGRRPEITKLRALGCQCWYFVDKTRRPTKLHPHMREARLLGYDERGNYTLYDVESKALAPVKLSAPSTVDDILPNTDMSEILRDTNVPPSRHVPLEFIEKPLVIDANEPRPAIPLTPIENIDPSGDWPEWLRKRDPRLAAWDDYGRKAQPEVVSTSTPEPISAPPNPISAPPKPNSTPPEPTIEITPLRRSTRVRKPTRAFWDAYPDTHAILRAHAVSFMDTDPIHMLAELDEPVLQDFIAFAAKKQPKTDSGRGYEPPSWKAAIDCADKAKWLEAAHTEWVFKIKADGTYKARLVVKGFRQRPTDFGQIYASVAKAMTFKVFIALAALHRLELDHVDIVAAFLHAELKEQIYVDLPEPFAAEPDKCGLLMKTLYGLKQSPREWHNIIKDALIAAGFSQSDADHCLFIKKDIFILVYVDDLLVMSPHPASVAWVKDTLRKHFEIVDKGPATDFLGIHIERDSKTIRLSQSHYVEATLKHFGLSNIHAVQKPYDDKLVLKDHQLQALLTDIKSYQERIGRLIWLMVNTRPDIAYATTKVARFARNPGPTHFSAVQKILRYLRGTSHLSLTYSAFDNSVKHFQLLHGFTDADWAGPHSEARLSTTGYVFKLAGGAVTWQSRKQTSVALSSTEAEYMGQSHAIQECVWLVLLLNELEQLSGMTLRLMDPPVSIFADNQGAIALAANPEHHARSKHVDVKFHFQRQHIDAGTCKLIFIPTTEMAADGLTKPLATTAFRRFVDMVGLT
ncbi:Reverse transcriptase RNA-dependent DNA polymerase [Penicillium sp. IBT 16267x]|nr:Reverse transcriptase RNA-dependent DNA polymerase [Penicillium sp. IBT 16267x]